MQNTQNLAANKTGAELVKPLLQSPLRPHAQPLARQIQMIVSGKLAVINLKISLLLRRNFPMITTMRIYQHYGLFQIYLQQLLDQLI